MSLAEVIETYQLLFSVIVAVIGLIFTYFFEKYLLRRKEKRETLIECLLPFFNYTLKIKSRLFLLGETNFHYELVKFNKDIKNLYEATGKAFYVIENPEQRQLITDTLQMLELFQDAIEKKFDQKILRRMRVTLSLNLSQIKEIVEEDLDQYKSFRSFPKFEDKTVLDPEGNIEINKEFIDDYINGVKGG